MDNNILYNAIRNIIEKFYKFPISAKVIKNYTENGKYYIDCQEVGLDNSVIKNIYPKVRIPKIWGSTTGGVFCNPSVGTEVIIGFRNGNKNFPYIQNVMGSEFDTERAENELIIIQNQTVLKVKDQKVVIKIGETSSFEITNNSIKLGGDEAVEPILKGNKELAILSDGSSYENIKSLKTKLKKLKYEQRQLSKKVKGSQSRNKQKIKLALDILQKTFISWTPSPQDGGAALKGAITGFTSLPLPNFSEINSTYGSVK